MNNLHLKAKVSFPRSFLFIILLFSNLKKKKKNPHTHKKGRISYRPRVRLPPSHPVRKRFKNIPPPPHPAHCPVPSSDTNGSGRNPTAGQTRHTSATGKHRLQMHRGSSMNPHAAPTRPSASAGFRTGMRGIPWRLPETPLPLLARNLVNT